MNMSENAKQRWIEEQTEKVEERIRTRYAEKIIPEAQERGRLLDPEEIEAAIEEEVEQARQTIAEQAEQGQ